MSNERKVQVESTFMIKYLDNVEQMNRSTATEYKKRLASFSDFVFRKYGYSIDHLINELIKNDKSLNVYEVLSSYVAFLNGSGTLSPQTINYRLTTAMHPLDLHHASLPPRP